MEGPQTAFSDLIHADKYRGSGESFRDAMTRVAGALTENEEDFRAFRDMLLNMRFLPAGRIQSAVGSPKRITPYNCYVSGPIQDSFVDGHGSIMGRATQAAQTMRMGGGIGYDFGTLRPRGADIKKLGSRSSGPVSFMEIFDAVCRCTASSGHRRGAQMGVMPVWHPDIEEFIRAKQNTDKLTGFNISIGVTDEFMEAVQADGMFSLRFENKEYSQVRARDLWDLIMRSTWDWAEPGVLFMDRINEMNNLWYCEDIRATNPCGEQPLPPYGACLLGSFNLPKYVIQNDEDGVAPLYKFDWDQYKADISIAVKAMDRVVDIATYPLFEQEQEAQKKRRMGLGVTGLANCIESLTYEYGSIGFLGVMDSILEILRNTAYESSALLAAERGPFPAFDKDKYLESKFVQRLPPSVISLILEHGMRNSHLTSIAPTGTISLCADNVSSGIEPVFSYAQRRTVIGPDGPETHDILDWGHSQGINGKVCADVTPDEHLNVLAVATKYVDSAVSKTCNVPADTPWEDFKGLYLRAWEMGCKGITTYQVGGKRGAILEESTVGSCEIDPTSGRKDCS